MPADTKQPTLTKRQRVIVSLLAGVLLAIVCQELPPDYRAVCEILATTCTGGH